MSLEKTWRWFGPKDNILLSEIKQTGAEGIVSSLHHIPPGEVWPVSEIVRLKTEIESSGLYWSVVESLPVSEEIKTGGPERMKHLENYRQSLENLGKCGIDTVVYNFMPVLDWARTNLSFRLPDGSEVMKFDYPTFAAFDVFILERPGAKNDYPEKLLQEAEMVFRKMLPDQAESLAHNIIVLTQGFIHGTVGDVEDYKKRFLEHLSKYRHIDEVQLRKNLSGFLNDIMPVADRFQIKMSAHPDDPPFPVLGLPRIISTAADLKWLVKQYPSLNNGLTFCAGSLSARKDNNLVKMVRDLAPHIHFIHLRATRVLENGSFYEDKHLEGGVDMYNLLLNLLKEQNRRIKEGRKDARMPFRPDHGPRMLDDFNRKTNPGYPLIGRMKGLAEISGLEMGIERSGLHLE